MSTLTLTGVYVSGVYKKFNHDTSATTYGENTDELYYGPAAETNYQSIGDFGPIQDYWSRAIYLYNTSSLGAGVTITKVEYFRAFDFAPAHSVSDYKFDYYLRNYSAATPTFNQDLYDGGTLCYQETGTTFSGTWLDLGANGIAQVNKTGYTLLKILDENNDAYGLGDSFFALTNQLRITYSIPQKYMAWGVSGGVSSGKIGAIS